MGGEANSSGWWLSHFESDNDANDCLSPPDFHKMKKIWKKDFPIFWFFTISIKDQEEHWKTIYDITSKLYAPILVESPLVDFQSFINSLHNISSMLSPKTITDAVKLIQKFGSYQQNPGYYLINQVPFLLNNLILYLKTIQNLIDTKDKLWLSLVSKAKYVNSFAKFYLGLLTPVTCKPSVVSKAWQHRLLLSNVLFSLIFESAKTNPDSISLATTYCDKLIKIIGTAPPEIEMTFVRNILNLSRKFAYKTPRDVYQNRFNTLLCAIAPKSDSISFPIIITYLQSSKPRIVSGMRILKAIFTYGIRSPTDIERIAAMADYAGPIPTLKTLARKGLESKLWHRTCFYYIRELIIKFSSDTEVIDWGQTFIRRLFIFVALATARNKYQHKILMLCESLSILSNVHLIWCQQTCHIASSSIYATHSVPSYFTQFFPILAQADPTLIVDFSNFNGNPIVLKTFPFDKKGNFVFIVRGPIEKLTTSPRSIMSKKITKPAVKKQSISPHNTRSKLPSLRTTKSKK